MYLGYLYQARIQSKKAIEYWQAAQTKLHPDSLEAKQIAQRIEQPYPVRLRSAINIVFLVVFTFTAFSLFRGNWLIATLTLLTFAAFITYRLWRRRRGYR